MKYDVCGIKKHLQTSGGNLGKVYGWLDKVYLSGKWTFDATKNLKISHFWTFSRFSWILYGFVSSRLCSLKWLGTILLSCLQTFLRHTMPTWSLLSAERTNLCTVELVIIGIKLLTSPNYVFLILSISSDVVLYLLDITLIV